MFKLNLFRLDKKTEKLISVFLGAAAGFFGILTSFLVARPLGAENYGQIQYYFSIVNIISLFVSFGIPFCLIRDERLNNNKFPSYMFVFDVIAVAIFPIYFVLAYFVLSQLQQDVLLIICIYLAGILMALTSIASSYYLGHKRLARCQLVGSFLPKFLIFALLVVAVNTAPHDVFISIYVPILVGIYLCCSIVFLIRHFRISRPKLSKKDLITLIVFLISSFATTVGSFLSKIIQGEFYSNLTILGVYSLSMQIMTAGVLFCSIITNNSQPFFAELNSKSQEETHSYFSHVLRLNSSIAIPFCVAACFGAYNILSLLGGDTYTNYSIILVFLSIATLVEVVVGPVNTYLSMCGHEKMNMINGLIHVAVLTILCYSLSFVSELGIPIAYLISNSVTATIKFIEISVLTKKITFDKKTLLFFAISSSISVLVFFGLSFVNKILIWLALNAVAGATIILFLLFKTPIKEDRITLTDSMKSVFKKCFNVVYMLLGLLFIFDVIIMGQDKYFLYFNIAGISITIRMILTLILAIFFVASLFINKNFLWLKSRSLYTISLMLIIAFIAFLVGWVRNGFSDSFLDLRSLAFLIVVFPFFDMLTMRLITKKQLFVFVNVWCVALALFLIGFHFYLRINHISNYEINHLFYVTFPDGHAFGFREPYGVIYDGMIVFVAITPAFFYLLLFKKNSPSRVVLYSAIFLIYSFALFQGASRGHEIAFFFSIAIIMASRFGYHIVNSKRQKTRILTTPFIVTCLILAVAFAIGTFIIIKSGILIRLFSGDSGSDSVRLNFLGEVIPQLFRFPFIFGKGFGYTIDSAVYWHIEMSLLEIFLKQGLIGFLIWLAPVYLLITSKNRRKDKHLYWFNIITVANLYLTSTFNPYLNCYLGTSMIVIILACDYSESVYQKDYSISFDKCKKVVLKV